MSNFLQLNSLSNKTYMPVLNQPQLIYVLTELTAGSEMAKVRMPLNFSLVLDRSGSMAGEKLRTMKEAVKQIIDQLEPTDVVSIVTFETNTDLLIPAQPASNKSGLKRKVDGIRDGGGTNMAPGLREGLSQVRQHLGGDCTSRVVLLTDGDATDNLDDVRHEADNCGAMGLPIIGMGFGLGWKEEFLFDLADRSHLAAPGSQTGSVWYIQNPADAAQVFDKVYQSMQIVAQDVTVSTRMVQGLEARRVWQVVPVIRDLSRGTIQGRAIVIPVGQMEKGGAAFLAEIMLPPRQAGAVRIAQTDATYQVPGYGSMREAVDLVVNYSTDPVLTQQQNGHVMNIVERVQAFKLQTQALTDAEQGNPQRATQKLRAAVTILLSQGETELANQIQQEANRLEQGQGISNEGKKTIKLTSSKTVKLSD